MNPISYLSSAFLGLLFTLLDCISYGKLLIPNHPDFSIFVFLYSTIVAQLLFTTFSSIKTGMLAGTILENIPLIKQIYDNISRVESDDVVLLQATMACLIAGTLLFSLVSFTMVKYRLGGYLKIIPKSAIFGCLGAIGMCQFKIGVESLTGACKNMEYLIKVSVWGLTVLISFLAFIIQDILPSVIYIIPLYTSLVTAVFYIFVMIKWDLQKMQTLCILPKPEDANFNLFNNFTMDYLKINNGSIITHIASNIMPIATLACMSLIHLPINLPVFCISTSTPSNLNSELRAQSLANLFTGVPSYFICSNSIFFNKAGASSKAHNYFLGLLTVALIGCKFVESYLPVFITNMFPFFIGLSIMIGIYRDSKARSLLDKLVILLCSIIGTYKMELAMVFGLLANGIWFIRQTVGIWKKERRATLNIENVVDLDFVVCFATVNLILERFSKKQKGGRLIVDMRNCGGVDWIGEEQLLECMAHFPESIVLGYKIGKRYAMEESELGALDLE